MPSTSIPNTFSNTPAGTNVIDAAQVNANYAALLAAVNNVDETQLTNAVLQRLGLNNGAQVGRGKSIIGTTETRTNTAYGTLTTPDQVTGIVLPTDGLIAVMYSATVQESVDGGGRAAIFFGANQLAMSQNNSTALVAQEGWFNGTVGVDAPLTTYQGGLYGSNGSATLATPAPATTGQLVGTVIGGGSPQMDGVGGPCWVFAAAGTYTISVQFKAVSGSVTAKNRKLWVWTTGF